MKTWTFSLKRLREFQESPRTSRRGQKCTEPWCRKIYRSWNKNLAQSPSSPWSSSTAIISSSIKSQSPTNSNYTSRHSASEKAGITYAPWGRTALSGGGISRRGRRKGHSNLRTRLVAWTFSNKEGRTVWLWYVISSTKSV